MAICVAVERLSEAKAKSRIRRQGDGFPGADASYLHGLPEVTATSFTTIFIDTRVLDDFRLDRIHDPRSAELFAGPLAIVHKSPPATSGRISVAITERDAVFNETFYGYSPHGHPAAAELVRDLLRRCWAASWLFRWRL